VLLQLSAFTEVPQTHGVIKTSRPQPRAVARDVDTTGAVGVALELPAHNQSNTKLYCSPTEARRCQ